VSSLATGCDAARKAYSPSSKTAHFIVRFILNRVANQPLSQHHSSPFECSFTPFATSFFPSRIVIHPLRNIIHPLSRAHSPLSHDETGTFGRAKGAAFGVRKKVLGHAEGLSTEKPSLRRWPAQVARRCSLSFFCFLVNGNTQCHKQKGREAQFV